MIALRTVSIIGKDKDRTHLLHQTSARFADHGRIGILAAPGTGKTTIAKVLSGIEHPDYGDIHSIGDVSWPLGFAGFLQPHLTIAENLSVIALIKQVSGLEYLAWCLDFSNLKGMADCQVADLSPSQRAALAYACVICLPWNWLVADDKITIGDAGFRAKCDAMLKHHQRRSGLVFLSRNARQLEKYCDQFFVLTNQDLQACDDIEVAEIVLQNALSGQAHGEHYVQA